VTERGILNRWWATKMNLHFWRAIEIEPIGYWQAIEIDTYWLSVGD
jgi:hypothetical protein